MDVYVIGSGFHLPTRVVSNGLIGTLTGLDPEWIRKKTGIERRFLTLPGDSASDMGAEAAKMALNHARIDPASVDLVAAASSFPDPYPPTSTAYSLAVKVGISHARVLDVSTPVIGFLHAFHLARRAIEQGDIEVAIVVGTEGFSAATSLKDRRTCYLYSDGAGAVILSRQEGPIRIGRPVRGLLRVVRDEPVDEMSASSQSLQGPPPYRFRLDRARYLGESLSQALDGLGKESDRPGPDPLSSAPIEANPSQVADPSLVDVTPLEASRTADPLAMNPIHDESSFVDLITQQFPPDLDFHLPEPFTRTCGFDRTGHLLSAALPILAHAWVTDAQRSNNAWLFAWNGHEAWSAVCLERRQCPPWVPLNLEGVQDSGVTMTRSPIPMLRSRVQVVDSQDLQRVLTSEIGVSPVSAGEVLAVTLGFLEPSPSEDSDPCFLESAKKEIHRILAGRVRVDDRVFEVEGRSQYVVLLRGIGAGDADRLGSRLQSVFRELDLSGEHGVSLDVAALYPTSGQIELFVETILDRLGSTVRESRVGS